jgi:hypothetical protein
MRAAKDLRSPELWRQVSGSFLWFETATVFSDLFLSNTFFL